MATYWQWKNLFISNYKDNSVKQTNAVNRKSMQFLNLHIGEHWPLMIRNFGCPSEYSTQHWESLHQIVKRKEKNTNHLRPSQDIACSIVEKHCTQLHYGNLIVNNNSCSYMLINWQDIIDERKPSSVKAQGISTAHKRPAKEFTECEPVVEEFCNAKGMYPWMAKEICTKQCPRSARKEVFLQFRDSKHSQIVYWWQY